MPETNLGRTPLCLMLLYYMCKSICCQSPHPMGHYSLTSSGSLYTMNGPSNSGLGVYSKSSISWEMMSRLHNKYPCQTVTYMHSFNIWSYFCYFIYDNFVCHVQCIRIYLFSQVLDRNSSHLYYIS